jgi:hypothetical protein
MLSHRGMGLGRIARFDGGDDRAMLGKTGMIARRPGGVADHGVPGDGATHLIKMLEQGQQQGVARRLGDRAMKKIVLLFIIVPCQRMRRPVARQLDPVHGGIGRTDRGLSCDRWLQRQAGAHQMNRTDLKAQLSQRAL